MCVYVCQLDTNETWAAKFGCLKSMAQTVIWLIVSVADKTNLIGYVETSLPSTEMRDEQKAKQISDKETMFWCQTEM